MDIVEVKFKCPKCGKEKTYNNIDLVEATYNQYVINVNDQKETNFDGTCECEYEEEG